MDLWYPPHDQPHLLEWWRPLIQASRAVRAQRIPWLLHVDEFTLVGRVDRRDRPPIWVYRHAESGRELYLDPTGTPHTFTRTPKAKAYGRFNRVDIRTAIWRAGLPSVIEPLFHDEPPAPRQGWDAEALDPIEPAPDPAASHPAARRRGHLTVLPGGRSLAG